MSFTPRSKSDNVHMKNDVHASKMYADNNHDKKYMKGAEPFFVMQSSEIGILLIHGFTSTPYQFKGLAQYLASQGLTVYAPIIAGHGTTPHDLEKTNSNDWIQSAENALMILKEKVKKVIIVGNSFGGNLALHLAAKYNNPLTGVVSLGTPIFLRYHAFLKLRLYTYGWFKKYYKKAGRNYKSDYIDAYDEISYPVIPTTSLRHFFSFIKNITLPGLHKIKSPTLIIQANADPVVHPKSVQFLHEQIGSDFKKVCWFNGNHHALTDGEIREEIFNKIYSFIQEIIKK